MNANTSNANFISDWTDNFLGILVNPRATMKTLASRTGERWTGIEGAVVTVILVSAVDGVLSSGPRFSWLLPFMAALGVLGGVFGWLVLVGPLALAAKAFNVEPARIRASFVTTAWGLLPWIFMAPLHAVRTAAGPAAVLLLLIPVSWIIYLEFLAVMEAYEIKGWQTIFLLFFMPQLALFMLCFWSAQVVGTSLNLILAGSSSGTL